MNDVWSSYTYAPAHTTKLAFRHLLQMLIWWLLLYSAILRSQADSLRSHVILHEWITFYSAFLNIHQSGVLTALAWLVPHESAAVSAQVLCTPYNHAPYHFMQSHICKMYVYLAVTCHLHFWQNDRGILRATVLAQPHRPPSKTQMSILKHYFSAFCTQK